MDNLEKLQQFLKENCGGTCHEWCEHWDFDGCQSPDNPNNKEELVTNLDCEEL